jgi:hypothetical protein
MTDESSENKTRYERLDPNVIQVFRLAELADKDNEGCHLGSSLKFSSDTAMNILMALDCEDNLPPLTEVDLLTFFDGQEPDISADTANIRAAATKKFATAVANLDGSAVQDIYHSATTSPPAKNLIAKISLLLKRSMNKHKIHVKLDELKAARAHTSKPVSPTPVPPMSESTSFDPSRQSAGYTDAIARGMFISDEMMQAISADPTVAELVELLQVETSSPKEAEERLLRLQQLFSSPATSVDSPIYILRYLSITFATDPAKTKAIQGSADDKAPLRKRFFRQIALLNATHLTMLEVTLGTGDMGEFLNDKARDSILSLIKALDFNKALDKLYLFTDNPVAFELGAKATLTQDMRIRALTRLLKAFYAIYLTQPPLTHSLTHALISSHLISSVPAALLTHTTCPALCRLVHQRSSRPRRVTSLHILLSAQRSHQKSS